MLTHPTLDQLRALRLDSMAQAFIELETQEATRDLTHAEWLALLLDREAVHRNTRRFQIRLRAARLRHSQAAIEDVDYRIPPSARQSAVPAVGRWPLDRRASRVANQRSLRHREKLVRLRARAESLPRRLHGPLRARAAPVRRSRTRTRRRSLRAAVPHVGEG
jgi:hypothetical protein